MNKAFSIVFLFISAGLHGQPSDFLKTYHVTDNPLWERIYGNNSSRSPAILL